MHVCVLTCYSPDAHGFYRVDLIHSGAYTSVQNGDRLHAESSSSALLPIIIVGRSGLQKVRNHMHLGCKRLESICICLTIHNLVAYDI